MYSILFGFLTLISFHGEDLFDSALDEKKVEESTMKWCEDNLHSYEGKKFEKYHAYYTDEFEMENIKVDMYTNQLESLERRKKTGKYSGTDEKYNAEVKAKKEKIEKTKQGLVSFSPKVTHYEIYLWTNIKTKQGKSVFIELYFKLNDDYKVVSHKINSAIGGYADPQKNEIIYK